MNRKRPDPFDDDRIRVTDPQGRELHLRPEAKRAVLEEARRMRAAGEKVGRVDPMLITGVDLEQVAARLRAVLAEVAEGRIEATDDERDRPRRHGTRHAAEHQGPARGARPSGRATSFLPAPAGQADDPNGWRRDGRAPPVRVRGGRNSLVGTAELSTV